MKDNDIGDVEVDERKEIAGDWRTERDEEREYRIIKEEEEEGRMERKKIRKNKELMGETENNNMERGRRGEIILRKQMRGREGNAR